MVAAAQGGAGGALPAPIDIQAEWALDASRKTALVKAVTDGDLASVQSLVEQDHELVRHTLNRKTTLLVLAVERGHLELSRYLLQRGCPVNNGHVHMKLSALHCAARLPDGEKLIRLLMQHGAKVNPTNLHNYGWWSPLHEAAYRRLMNNALVLAELGADPTSRDGRGMTPFDVAGHGSAVAKAIKEGVRCRKVRMMMHRLHSLASVDEGREGGAGICSVIAARRAKERPLPILRFLGEIGETSIGVSTGSSSSTSTTTTGSGSRSINGRKKHKAGKQELKAHATAGLLHTLFRELPHYVRRLILAYV